MFADSLVRLLDDEPDLEVVGVASTIATAIDASSETHPDVVLLDFRLPDGDAPSCIARLKAVSPGTQVLIMTGLDDEATLRAAREAGCQVVTKNRAASELIRALRGLTDSRAGHEDSGLFGQNPPAAQLLSKRERELMVELARGRSTADIAADLHISATTVRNHVQRILAKLGAHSRLEAVAIAVQKGIIDR